MDHGRKRPRYQAPRAVDLTSGAVHGQSSKPTGFCGNGSNPSSITPTCTNGAYPSSDPLTCNPMGLSPEYGKCSAGGNPLHFCGMGSFVTS
jgi:hypothetical protein